MGFGVAKGRVVRRMRRPRDEEVVNLMHGVVWCGVWECEFWR
jgi:hypothetical protein